MRIAIVGTGIAGLGAAHQLHKHVDLAVFEAADWIGGHSHTVDVPLPGCSVAVDTGFIVYNNATYPLLTQLFAELEVPTKPSDMSFAVAGEPREYEGSVRGMFAARRAVFDAQHWLMIRDILTFNRRVRDAAGDQLPHSVTLGDFTADLSNAFRDRYLLPMCAAIWSTPEEDMANYPAQTLIRFFNNHGLIQLKDRPQWRTVTGGSRIYVNKLISPFRDRIHTNTPVQEIRRTPSGVDLVLADSIESFDGVLLATHADVSLKILNGSATTAEQSILSNFAYSQNHAVLHSDASFMPAERRAWASWNVTATDKTSLPSVTYWMNRLQNLDTPDQLFLTLNPAREPQHIWGSWMYDHPMFDSAAIAAQSDLPGLQGRDRVWFAGAYFRYGFHEDGLMAGYAAAESLLRQLEKVPA